MIIYNEEHIKNLDKFNHPVDKLLYCYKHGLVKDNYYTSSYHWEELGPCARAG